MEEGQLDHCNKMDIINWKQNLDVKKLAGVFSSDISKAFDSLHSPLFLANLRAFYGFSDEVLGLIQSYFCERKCRVRSIQKQPVCGMKQQGVTRKDLSLDHSYGMYSRMICITGWKTELYSCAPVTINEIVTCCWNN